MTILTGKARLAGITGWPVSHSRSPRLHGFWLEQYGIDGAYLPLPIDPANFAAAVRGLDGDFQILFDVRLAGEIVEAAGAERRRARWCCGSDGCRHHRPGANGMAASFTGRWERLRARRSR